MTLIGGILINIIFTKKGATSLIGVLAASAIGIVVIGGLTKSMLHNAEQEAQTSNERRLDLIKENVISVLRSTNAWRATINFENPAHDSCYPGSEKDGVICPINLYYNKSNPDNQDAYNTRAKKWVCNVVNKNHGIGLVNTMGDLIFSDDNTEWKNCCANTLTDGLSDCSFSPNFKYLVVEVSPPSPLAESEASIPSFGIKIIDPFFSKKTTSFTLMDSNLTGSNLWSEIGDGRIYFNDGNVGIKNDNPTGVLELGDGTTNSRTTLVLNADEPRIYYKTDSDDYNWRIGTDAGAVNILGFASGNKDADPSDDTYTPRLTINAVDGKVGIGTATPEVGLQVASGHAMTTAGWGANIMSNSYIFPRSLIGGPHYFFIAAPSTTNQGNLYFGITSKIDGTTPPIYNASIIGSGPSKGRWTFNQTIIGYISPPSDRRLKKEIRPLENSLKKIKKLRGVSFKWRKENRSKNASPDNTNIGLIAQEVEKVYPEFVIEGPNGKKGIYYSQIVAVLIEGIKEQDKTIQNLKVQIDDGDDTILKNKHKIKSLEERISLLENALINK